MKHSIEYREEEQALILKAQRGNDRSLSHLLQRFEKFAIDLGGTHGINEDDASGIYLEKFMPALMSWKPGDAVFSAFLKVILNRAFISFNRPKHRKFLSIDAPVKFTGRGMDRAQETQERKPEAQAIARDNERLPTLADQIQAGEIEEDAGDEALSIARDIIHYAGRQIIDHKAEKVQVKLFEQFLNLRRSERCITKSELIQVRATIGLPVAQFILIDFEDLAQTLLDDYLLLCERGLAANLRGVQWKNVHQAIGEDREAVSILRRQWKLLLSVATGDE